MLERMPVIDKSSPCHSNGESEETIKERPKLKQADPVVAQEPANQVRDDKDSFILDGLCPLTT